MMDNQWVIGHRDANGWHVDLVLNEVINVDTDYRLRLLIENDTTVTLFADGVEKLTHQYAASVTDGDVGLATRSSTTHFDNILVEEFYQPTAGTLPISEDFADGRADHFQKEAGTAYVQDSRLRLVPDVGQDGISTVWIGETLPADLELHATIHGESVPGYYHNVLVIFDYQSETDFKFAGAYVGQNLWVIGRRTASGWAEDVELPDTINTAADYNVQLVINGTNVHLLVDGVKKVSHAYADALTDGAVGLGTQNAVAQFDNVVVQAYVPPPSTSLPVDEDFDDGVADFFDVDSGVWTVTAGRYRVEPSIGSNAISTIRIGEALPANLELQATISGESVAGYYHNVLLVFDYQGETDFKFAGAYVGGNRWVIGRRTAGGWVEDVESVDTINTATDYDVRLVITGTGVELQVGGETKVSHTYGDALSDGAVGLGTQFAVAEFDNVVVQEYVPPPPPLAGSLPILEDFDDGLADFFDINSGTWTVTGDRYRVVPGAASNAVSTIRIGEAIPSDFEIQATIHGESVAGYYHNVLLAFDYQSETDFKFAGAYVGGNRWVIGRRTASGWIVDADISETINTAADYDVQAVITGSRVELLVAGISKVSHTFGDVLADGAVGLGTHFAVAQFDNVVVQAYDPPPPPPAGSLPLAEDFDDGAADFFDVNSGAWTVINDRYRVVPSLGNDAITTIRVADALPTDLDVQATIHGESVSGYYHNALVVFDHQNATDFKFAGAYVGGNRWVIGRRTASGWIVDAEISETINTATDYDVQLVISGTDLQLLVGGAMKVSHNFGDLLTDGAVGLATQNAVAQFDNVVVQAYVPPPPPSMAALPMLEDFDDGVADFFDVHSGTWTVAADRYRVVPNLGSDALSTIRIGEPLPDDFEIQATINGESVAGYYHNVLLVFDHQSDTDFKFAGAYVGGNRWVVGRRTSSGWVVDAQFSETINTAADYDVRLEITGAEVQLLVGGVTKVAHTFGDVLNDGVVGLATQNAVAQFDNVVVQALSGGQASLQLGPTIPQVVAGAPLAAPGYQTTNIVQTDEAPSVDLSRNFLPAARVHRELLGRLNKRHPFVSIRPEARIVDAVFQSENEFDAYLLNTTL